MIAIETERIEKDRQLEVISRERETELSKIAKDKELEVEKRAIAEVVRERIAVDKTVAEQEETIKRLRAVEEAERMRQALIIQAEAEAQEKLVKDIKAAEAAETAAKYDARRELAMAEARQQSAELETRAKIRLAEGVQAEAAAAGLAEVQVRERGAEALEKVGRAEATVDREKALARAEAAEKIGLAETEVERQKALAKAEATAKIGLAETEIERQKAIILADALRDKLKGEAEGLTEKAAALAAMTDATREHEEYRLRLDAEKDIQLAGLEMQGKLAESQALVIAAGLEKADIDIVGGDTMFFDRVVGAVSAGKSIDGFVEHSNTAQTLAKPWLNGTSNFTDDITRVLGGLDTNDVKNLTVSALLVKLIGSGGKESGKLQELLDTANRLGIGDHSVTALLPTQNVR